VVRRRNLYGSDAGFIYGIETHRVGNTLRSVPRDYRLHELNDREFECPVVRIRANWLGQGV
jgi:hypothetical protein